MICSGNRGISLDLERRSEIDIIVETGLKNTVQIMDYGFMGDCENSS